MPPTLARRTRLFRWTRRSLLGATALAGMAIAWDVATYDEQVWLADYQRLKHDMAQGYANLDWIRTHRHVDLAALDARTTAALTGAHSRLRAFLALRRFVRGFDDPHLRLEPRASAANAPARAQANSVEAIESQAVAAIARCEDAGYSEGAHDFGFAFERVPGWVPLRGGDLPLGMIDDVGVLRIAQFGEQRYVGACRKVFRAGMDERALQLAVRAHQQQRLIESLSHLRQAGARRLLVDLTGNGGGSEWVSEVIALMTDRTLARSAARIVGPRCDRSAVWRNEAACSVFAMTEPQQVLQGTGAWTAPVMILVDGRTASASEDFVAWLQQNGVATVIGETTLGAGCGYVDGGTRTSLRALSLDVVMPNCARFLENGRNEIEGIAPDVPLALTADDAPERLRTRLASLPRHAAAAGTVIRPPLPAPATGVRH